MAIKQANYAFVAQSASPSSTYPTRSTSTLSRADGSMPSALECLSQIHRRAMGTHIEAVSEKNKFASSGSGSSNGSRLDSSTRSGSYAESMTSVAWSDDYKEEDGTCSSNGGGSETSEDRQQEFEILSDVEDQPRHEKGWRGLNTVMPISSKLSAAMAPTDSFDSTEDVNFIPLPSDPYSLKHSEYGFDMDPAHRTTSIYTPGSSLAASSEEPGLSVLFATYISYLMLICVGHVRDFFGKWLFPGDYQHLQPHEVSHPISCHSPRSLVSRSIEFVCLHDYR